MILPILPIIVYYAGSKDFCCLSDGFVENSHFADFEMVFIIHRYLFREMLRVFGLTTLALTVILSLGMSIRPVNEYGIGPMQVLHLLGYFLPITLTFILPISALFAAALVYGRFASDNEFDACRASGISTRMLMDPALLLALLVAIANLVLSFHSVPVYVRRAERAIKADAQNILFRNIERCGYYDLPGDRYRLYADYADKAAGILGGVVMVDGKSKDDTRLTTSDSAKIEFRSHKRYDEIMVHAYNAFQLAQAEKGFSEWITISMQMPAMISDDVKFQKIDEIRQIRRNPLTYYPIAELACAAYVRLATEMIHQDILDSFARNEMSYELSNPEKIVKLRADDYKLTDENKIKLEGNVRLDECDAVSGRLIQTYDSNQATIGFVDETPESLQEDRMNLRLIVTMPGARWKQDGREYPKYQHVVSDLNLPDNVAAKLAENLIRSVVKHEYLPRPSEKFEYNLQMMQKKIRRTLMQITAETHARLVFGLGCVLLIIIGGGMGIIFRGGHLLSAFGVSFIPAAGLIVFILMGKNMAKSAQSAISSKSGVALIWLGLIFLFFLAVWVFRKIAKG